MRSTFLLSALALAVGGCGDHGLPPPEDMSMAVEDMSAELDMGIPNDAKKTVTFTTFAQDFAQALCAHYMACGQLDAAQLNACIENQLRHTGWDQDVEIMKNRVEINELQCLDAVNHSRCDNSDINAWSTRCLQFLYTGHQANGAACIADVECTSGYCQHAGSDAGIAEQVTGCPGVCAAPKATGAPCRLATDCASDSFCDTVTTNQCQKLAALNEQCTNNFLGIGSGPACQVGLNCPSFPPTMPPTCSVPSTKTAVGDDCDPFQGVSTPTPACASGMYCQFQYTATTTACTAGGSECNPTSWCNTTTGFCQDLSGGKCATKLAAGADCDPNNDSFSSFVNDQCADGTVCAQIGTATKYTCTALGGANADCVDDTNCKFALYCSGGKCTPWISDGQACDPNAPFCMSETQQNVCIADNADAGGATTCQVTKNIGGACNPGFEDSLCEPSDLPGSSTCVPNGSGGGTCAPKCF